jgi:acetoin utilization deacetylase AcuC-like enzyme
MALAVFTHAAMLAHDVPGHVERPARLASMTSALRASGLPLDWREAPPAAREDLLTVHAEAHVRRVEDACARGATLDPDTHARPATWDAALVAAGAALAAADEADAGRSALALVRPPGHHATPTRAMGFCFFNTVALAAERLARRGRRVAIVDVDVHHGNGTQDAFWTRGDVLFASLHQWPLYPGTGAVEEAGAGDGEGATLNLPMPAGTGHEGWLEAFDAAVMPKVRAFAPDVILVSVGYDADHRDPLGGMRLTPATFHAAVTRLRTLTPRLAVVTEGGYDLDAVGEGVAATAAALVGARCPPALSGTLEGPRPWPHLAARVSAAHPALP